MATIDVGGFIDINGTVGSGCTVEKVDFTVATAGSAASYCTVNDSEVTGAGSPIDATDNCTQGTGTISGWTFSGGATNYPLAAAAGAFTLAGGAVTFSREYELSAAAGAFTLTGGDVTFAYGELLNAAAGAFTLTGGDVTFSRDYALGAAAGSYTLTGGAVTFDYAQNTNIPILSDLVATSITATGIIPRVDYSLAEDTTAPSVTAATVATNGLSLLVTANDVLVSSTSPTGWTLTADGSSVALSAPIFYNNFVEFTTAQVYAGQTVLLSYSSTTGDVTDGANPANDLATFSDTAVTNSSTVATYRSDYFINADGTDIESHTMTMPDTYRSVLPGAGGEWTATAGNVEIQNNLTDIVDGTPTEGAKFWVGHTDTTNAQITQVAPVPASFILRQRIFHPNVGTYICGPVICFHDTGNYLAFVIRESDGLVRMDRRNGGTLTSQTLATGAATDCEHLWEIEVDGDDVEVYLDNVRVNATYGTISIATELTVGKSNKVGWRATGTTERLYEHEVQPYRTITRYYFSTSGNDSTGDGSYATPWATTDKIESEAAANGGGYRYLLKRGDTFAGTPVILNTSNDATAIGSGTDFNAWTPIEFGDYGYDSAVMPKVNYATTLTTWAGPSGSEYSKASSGVGYGMLIEDGVLLNGSGASNAATSSSGNYDAPQAGSLGAGEWQCGVDNSTVYYYPTTLTPADHTVEITGDNKGFYFDASGYIRMWGIHTYGASSVQGQIGIGGGGAYIWIEHCKCEIGYGGIAFGGLGSGYAIGSHVRMWNNEASDMHWRGIGSINPNLLSGYEYPHWFGNHIHDCFRHPGYRGDQEPAMVGPGDDHAQFLFNVCWDNGWLDSYGLDIPGSGEMTDGSGYHPGGLTCDGGDDVIAAYNVIGKGRSAVFTVNPDDKAQTAYLAYNNIAIDMGEDKGDQTYGNGSKGRHCFLHVRAESTGGYDAEGIQALFNTVSSCEWEGDSGSDSAINIVFRNNNKTADVTSKYNVFADHVDTGVDTSYFYRQTDNGTTPTMTWTIDRNCYHMASGTSDGSLISGTATSYASMSGGWGPGSAYDANSTFTDVDLSATFVPNVGSPAIALAVTSDHPDGLDFYLRKRDQNATGSTAAGAVAAAAEIV